MMKYATYWGYKIKYNAGCLNNVANASEPGYAAMYLNLQVSNEKYPGCLGYVGDYTTSSIGIITSHNKSPY